MALKMILKTLEGLDETIAAMYRKEGDQFVLDLSTDQLREHPSNSSLISALERERQERKDAQKLSGDLKDKYGDLDVDAALAALKAQDDIKDKELLDEGKVEELIAQRTERMRLDFDKQLAAKDAALAEINGNLDTRSKELSDIKIYDAVKDAALGKGARKEALQDIKNRAAGTWQLKDGKPTAMNGEDIVFGKSGEPLTIDEWVDGLSNEASYLFEPNKGAGGQGNDDKGAGVGIKILAPSAAGDNLAAIARGEAVIQR